MPCLSQLEERGYQYYFHYTLNDYHAEDLEPQVPALSKRLDAFKELSDRIGPERVIWRYDPIILGQSLSIERVLERIDTIGKILAPFTTSLVFSYLDMYKKCAGTLRKHDSSLRVPNTVEMQSLAQGIAALNTTWTRPLQLATCAEALDVSQWGIKKNSCVDPALILRLCPGDTALQALYGTRRAHKQGTLVDMQRADAPEPLHVKDAGQRKTCACAPSKDIGAYNTCLHGCVYCYACQSAQVVARTLKSARSEGESLA